MAVTILLPRCRRQQAWQKRSKDEGWFTLGLRKAEQSMKTGLFYYDEITMPYSA